MVAPSLETSGSCPRIIYGSPIFVYSAYWRSWSRRLMVEVRPISGCRNLDYSIAPIGLSRSADEWVRDVLPIKLRFHSTEPAAGDKKCSAKDLPIELISLMHAMVGQDNAAALLYSDVYPIIDWTKFEERTRLHYGGGIALEAVKS